MQLIYSIVLLVVVVCPLFEYLLNVLVDPNRV